MPESSIHVGILGHLEQLRDAGLELPVGGEKRLRDERFTVTLKRTSLYLYTVAIVDWMHPGDELIRPREANQRGAHRAVLLPLNRIRERLDNEARAQ